MAIATPARPTKAGAGGASVGRRFLNETELSELTGIATRTLQRWRLENRGPRFRKLGGAVRYEMNDVNDWVAACPSGGGNNEPRG
jgi:predicted DNA-binding transcriptional regulator AlpA